MTRTEILEGLRQVQAILQVLVPAAQALEGEPSEQDGRKYTAADRQRWRNAAVAPDLMLHTDRAKARLIVKREGLPESAFESVRHSLKKLGSNC